MAIAWANADLHVQKELWRSHSAEQQGFSKMRLLVKSRYAYVYDLVRNSTYRMSRL